MKLVLRRSLQGIESSLVALRHDPGLPDYLKIMRPFRRTTAALWQLFDAVKHGKSDEANEASGVAAEEMYGPRASWSARRSGIGRTRLTCSHRRGRRASPWFCCSSPRSRGSTRVRPVAGASPRSGATSSASTRARSRAVAELTAARLGLPADERQRIRLAAELHDIGKAAIPDVILNKPGELDENEWAFIRRHPGRTVSDTAAA